MLWGRADAPYGLIDEAGSPRLEKLLSAVPGRILIGHATGFWAEISGEIKPEDKFIYPKGRVEKEGSLFRLLRTYPNLFADISANSGFNLISRDRELGVRFLCEFQDRVLFGTDVCFADPKGSRPTLRCLKDLLASGEISRTVFDKITD